MADLIDVLPPELDPNRPAPALQPLDDSLHLSGELKEEGVLASLFSSFRDAFFPEKLPPLVLESTPIAVPDRMTTPMSKQAVAYSITFYALLILLIAWAIAHHIQITAPPLKQAEVLTAPPMPPLAPVKKDVMGGGGGANDHAPVSKGRLPKPADVQIVPPKAPPTIPPKLAREPTLVMQKDIQLANNTMPNLGDPKSTAPGISLGNGGGGGIGSGSGAGLGPGSGGNTGSGIYHVGGGVSAPVLLYHPDAEFTEEARKNKFYGNVLVDVVVDEQGRPTNVRCVRDVGMGLGEKAVEAVRLYKFKPSMKDGKPVKVEVTVNVDFQIF
jgi:protein TonB